jgi:hypothetical protein
MHISQTDFASFCAPAFPTLADATAFPLCQDSCHLLLDVTWGRNATKDDVRGFRWRLMDRAELRPEGSQMTRRHFGADAAGWVGRLVHSEKRRQ